MEAEPAETSEVDFLATAEWSEKVLNLVRHFERFAPTMARRGVELLVSPAAADSAWTGFTTVRPLNAAELQLGLRASGILMLSTKTTEAAIASLETHVKAVSVFLTCLGEHSRWLCAEGIVGMSTSCGAVTFWARFVVCRASRLPVQLRMSRF